MSEHILVAEDEPKIASLLVDYLEAAGMRATVVATGKEVVPAVTRLTPDLLLLDLTLPGRDGLGICRELRRSHSLPIIMVTARVEEIDRLRGLEAGADDYVCKPFSPREVVARVKTVLRRSHAETEPAEIQRIRIDQHRMQLSVDDKAVDLTPVEFRLFSVLHGHPGRVYRRDELLDRIYEDFRDVSDRTVDSHIKNLRRKLARAAPGARFIRAVYGIGYRFEPDEGR